MPPTIGSGLANAWFHDGVAEQRIRERATAGSTDAEHIGGVSAGAGEHVDLAENETGVMAPGCSSRDRTAVQRLTAKQVRTRRAAQRNLDDVDEVARRVATGAAGAARIVAVDDQPASVPCAGERV